MLTCAANAARASATPSLAPIRVERCTVASRSVLHDPFNGFRTQEVTGVDVRFVDVGPTAAVSVQLTIRYEGMTRTFIDRGIAAPGTPIDRTFAAFAGASSGGDTADCRIDAATFRDGSTWTAIR